MSVSIVKAQDGVRLAAGIHCRLKPREAWESAGQGEPFDEIFAVVAAPETGAAVRIFLRAPRADADPAALGRLTAQKLIEAGAGPLLEAVGGVAR